MRKAPDEKLIWGSNGLAEAESAGIESGTLSTETGCKYKRAYFHR